MRVLLVEDNPGDIRLIRESLRERLQTPEVDDAIELRDVSGLDEAITTLQEGAFDAVLLDLGLPESQGLETFRRFRASIPDLPTVVLSGLADEAMAVQAVREGAQDYLVKGQADSRLLERSLRYAIARRRAEREEAARRREQAERAAAEAELRRSLEAEREQRERLESEMRSLQRLSQPVSGSVSVTAASFGMQPLRTAAPEAFGAAVVAYGEVLDLALEQRTYRVEHNLRQRLRGLAETLGFLGAGPRDVVEVHTAALRPRIADSLPPRAQAYVEESRLLALELMGHLAAYYRAQRGGRPPTPPAPSAPSAVSADGR